VDALQVGGEDLRTACDDNTSASLPPDDEGNVCPAQLPGRDRENRIPNSLNRCFNDSDVLRQQRAWIF
jgi:hypothetical protein